MLDLFGDQLEKTDFHTNPDAVRDHINQWVSNMTKGHIRDLLPVNSIGVDTDLVLANAVYFKGLWESRFNPTNSKKDIFYISNSQHSMTTFMKQSGHFNHRKLHILHLWKTKIYLQKSVVGKNSIIQIFNQNRISMLIYSTVIFYICF